MTFVNWLRSRTLDADGFYALSEVRPFTTDEAAYDTQYDTIAPDLSVGRHMVERIRSVGCSTTAPFLEIGCGTGVLSVGVVAEGGYPHYLVTDSSAAFLRLTRAKIKKAALEHQPVSYCVLNGDDLHLLPPEGLSIIAMRSVLHHILDLKRFFAEANAALVPGGALVFSEPCAEAFILMGTLASFVPAAAQQAGEALTEKQWSQLKTLLSTVCFYARRDVDKNNSEDKYVFRVGEIAALAESHGFEMHYYPDDVPTTFASQFRDYLIYCMSFDEEFVAFVLRVLAPSLAFVEACGAGTTPLPQTALFVCKKKS